jgi:N-acetyl-anhydromuramyl-L-alanine amidase AmpD
VLTQTKVQRLEEPLRAIVGGLATIPLLIAAFSPIVSAMPATNQHSRQQSFANAAKEFGVPEKILLALSYNESRWDAPSGMSNDGGYGLTDLRTTVPAHLSGRGTGETKTPKEPVGYYTLDTAASLLHESKNELETNDTQNIRGAAAVLAQDAKQLNGGKLPASINDWYDAVAKYSGATNTQTAQQFANDVFSTAKSGASRMTSDGQDVQLSPSPNVEPGKSLNVLNLNNSPMLPGQNAECPATLSCQFIPAAYAQDDPNDPTNYGNYDPAHRPADMKIKYIFIHDMEGSFDSSISWFQNPAAYASAQYMVRSSDGDIVQMVPNEDVSWGVYDWYDNMHGINIENEGFAAQGATWFTPVMYRHEATLVRWLAAKYHIPLDRQHILGHDNIPTLTSANFPNQHWDPGPFWNWDYFMNLVHGKNPATNPVQFGSHSLKAGDVVTISPNFATNQPTVTDCQTGTCETLPAQGASFVYLHTQPNNSSALLSDKYVHPDNSAGTTSDDDWGDKASSGEQFVVAGIKHDWTGIYYGGQIGWFYNPAGSGQTAVRAFSQTITPRNGLGSISVYGGAYPEPSAYPSAIPVQKLDMLYTISAGQSYTTTGENLPTDYFYDATVNYSLPDDHMIVHGKQKYYQIWFNHRIAYVKANEVTIK